MEDKEKYQEGNRLRSGWSAAGLHLLKKGLVLPPELLTAQGGPPRFVLGFGHFGVSQLVDAGVNLLLALMKLVHLGIGRDFLGRLKAALPDGPLELGSN